MLEMANSSCFVWLVGYEKLRFLASLLAGEEDGSSVVKISFVNRIH